MSISFIDVIDKEALRKSTTHGIKKYVSAKVEPCITNQLPFPSDYEFSSCYLPKKYLQVADSIFNVEIRPDDVWVVAFQKAGSTWMSNIVWQLQQNLDFSADFLRPAHMYMEIMLNFTENVASNQIAFAGTLSTDWGVDG